MPEGKLEKERIIHREIKEYADAPAATVLHENFVLPEHEAMHAALKLEPEEHDTQIDSILQMVGQKGIRNALSVAARMKNPHLEDDVHRALVRYVVEGLSVKGIKPSAEVWKALHLTLFEIQPQGTRDKQEGNQLRKSLEQVLASTEQLYAGLLNMTHGGGMFSMEIAVAQGTEEAVFYIAVPHDKRTLFERQVFRSFPMRVLPSAAATTTSLPMAASM